MNYTEFLIQEILQYSPEFFQESFEADNLDTLTVEKTPDKPDEIRVTNDHYRELELSDLSDQELEILCTLLSIPEKVDYILLSSDGQQCLSLGLKESRENINVELESMKEYLQGDLTLITSKHFKIQKI